MSFYLKYMTVFLIQLFPCIFLIIIPFFQKQLRFKKKKTAALMTILNLIEAAFFPVLVKLICGDADGLEKFRRSSGEFSLVQVGNRYKSAVVVVNVIALFHLINAEFSKKVIVTLLAFNYAILIYIMVNLGIYLGEYNSELYSENVIFMYIICTLLTYPFAIIFLRKNIKRYLNLHSLPMIKRSMFIVIFITIMFGIYMNMAEQLWEMLYENQGIQLRCFLAMSYLFGIVCICIIYWYMFWEIDYNIRQNNYKNQLDIQILCYKEIQNDIETMRKTRHDMRHHLRILANFLAENRQKDAMNYLEHVTGIIITQETETFCVEPAINSVLQYYVGEARQYGIKCDIQVKMAECKIEIMDMTMIIGNCLENAVHACKELEGERFIRLKIGMVNSTIAMVMENSSAGQKVKMKKGKVETNGFRKMSTYMKRDDGTGIGLLSIASTVKKYKGTAEFKYEEGVFYSRISLEIPEFPE